MAYCRWGEDSDVFSYGGPGPDEGECYTSHGYRIGFMTSAPSGDYYDCTQQALYDTLMLLRKSGYRVPEHAFEILKQEVDDEIAEFEYFQGHPEYQRCLSTCKFLRHGLFDEYACTFFREELVHDEAGTAAPEGLNEGTLVRRCQGCLDSPPALCRPAPIQAGGTKGSP